MKKLINRSFLPRPSLIDALHATCGVGVLSGGSTFQFNPSIPNFNTLAATASVLVGLPFIGELFFTKLHINHFACFTCVPQPKRYHAVWWQPVGKHRGRCLTATVAALSAPLNAITRGTNQFTAWLIRWRWEWRGLVKLLITAQECALLGVYRRNVYPADGDAEPGSSECKMAINYFQSQLPAPANA